MPIVNNDLFYNRLPVNAISLSDLLTEDHLFYQVPSNWHVIITDVKDSTKAALEGKNQTVNLVATGSIVAALNIAYKKNITIPFFFGGDGATFVIPPTLLDETLKALQIHRENILKSFDLYLRVGHVPVNEIYEQHFNLKISKLKSSDLFTIPVMLGDGLSFAEKKIKGKDYSLNAAFLNDMEIDMSGMHCRWDKIKPPETNFEIISMQVIAKNNDTQAIAFKSVIDSIDKIFGTPDTRKPISISKLKMKATLEKVATEMRARLGGFNLLYLVRTWVSSLIGKIYFQTKKGKEYLYKLVELADTLVIDGKINTVITGTTEQRKELESVLNELESRGEILYGLHVSNESVMSCYVRNLNDQHIHFVDGADGGYTKASGVLKLKLNIRQ